MTIGAVILTASIVTSNICHIQHSTLILSKSTARALTEKSFRCLLAEEVEADLRREGSMV